MKEKKLGKDGAKNRIEESRSWAEESSQTDLSKESASSSAYQSDSSTQEVRRLKRPGHGRKVASDYPGARLVRLNHPEMTPCSSLSFLRDYQRRLLRLLETDEAPPERLGLFTFKKFAQPPHAETQVEELFLQYYYRILEWALHLTDHRVEQAEDLAHDAFEQLTMSRDQATTGMVVCSLDSRNAPSQSSARTTACRRGRRRAGRRQ
jgi:hypothetical protein